MGDHEHTGDPNDCAYCREWTYDRIDAEMREQEGVTVLQASRTHAVGCMCPRCSHAGTEVKHITLLTEERVREIVREEIAAWEAKSAEALENYLYGPGGALA